jgi:NTE family protein
MPPARSDRLEDALHRIIESGCNTPASWFALTGGETLFAEGDPSDTLYLLRAGRLGVFRREANDQPPQFVGVIRPGEPAGEMAMLAGSEHTADVVALRDSEILALPRDAFFEAARTEPDLMVELSRLMIQRARDRRSGGGEPSVFGFISARPRPIRAFVERVAAAIEADGFTCQVIDHSALSSAAEWFSRVEDSHDFVLYVAEADEPAWGALCARQVDRVFVVGQCLLAPPNRPMPHAGVLDAQRRTDLILLRDPRMARPANTSVWIDAVQPGRWFQAQEGDQADADRIARVITGTGVGVVMSGGGARAYSHIGALRALKEAGVPVDFVGGSSMGAVIAAGPAMGWSLQELEERISRSFVDSDPLSDITFPMLAMTRAKKVDRLLEAAYGDIDMADLALPFFAVSTNLTSGRIEVHRRGLMRRAMRASIAIPGLLPPIVLDGQVLVDGAVLNNLPAEVMRQMNSGPVIGIDMSQARGVDPALIEHPPSIWRLLATGAWRRGPPIVSIMMRSATLTTDAEIERSRAIVDILVQPTPDGVDIRDWKAFTPAVDAGYRAMRAELDKLDGPVSGLRRRRPVASPPETDAGTAEASPRPDVEETPKKGRRPAKTDKRPA